MVLLELVTLLVHSFSWAGPGQGRAPSGHGGLFAMSARPPTLHAVDVCTTDVSGLAGFYEACFGMERVASSHGGPVEMGFRDDATHLRLVECASSSFRVGEGFDSVAIYVENVSGAVDRVEAHGGKVLVPPSERTVGPSKIPDEAIGTKHTTFEALVSDIQGYRFRLIQRKDVPSRIAKVVLRVTDLEKSKVFYSELLGLSLLRWRSNLQSEPADTSLTVQLGDPSALQGAAVLEAIPPNVPHAAILELIYPFNTRKMDIGEGGAGKLTIATANVIDLAARAPGMNGKLVSREADSGEADLRDPDGHSVRLVEAALAAK